MVWWVPQLGQVTPVRSESGRDALDVCCGRACWLGLGGLLVVVVVVVVVVVAVVVVVVVVVVSTACVPDLKQEWGVERGRRPPWRGRVFQGGSPLHLRTYSRSCF